MSIETLRLTDKTAIRAYLNRDRALTAYALGDLDDAFWPDSVFYGARQGGRLAALVLLYHGLTPPVLTAFGDPDSVRAIFDTQPLPDEIYYLMPPELETLLGRYFELPEIRREWRMVLDAEAFVSPPLDRVSRLGGEHTDTLMALYRQEAGPGEEVIAFSPWQIAHGAFFGVWDGGNLVAAAGTHVWSQAEGVTAIGNVFTHPAHRGRGYATECTAAVVQAALAAGLDTVVLNVRQDNAPAIHVYEKLGFRLYHTFLEGPGWART
ncbi:MAG: GNAT family N-acetyltransferase [Anaerolineae bacterium]|nr:GNAT family N-acetyltransferase [Anaerolineae bacterium]